MLAVVAVEHRPGVTPGVAQQRQVEHDEVVGVVDLVGDPRDQGTQGDHLLRLDQLPAVVLGFFFRPLAAGDVDLGTPDAGQGAVLDHPVEGVEDVLQLPLAVGLVGLGAGQPVGRVDEPPQDAEALLVAAQHLAEGEAHHLVTGVEAVEPAVGLVALGEAAVAEDALELLRRRQVDGERRPELETPDRLRAVGDEGAVALLALAQGLFRPLAGQGVDEDLADQLQLLDQLRRPAALALEGVEGDAADGRAAPHQGHDDRRHDPFEGPPPALVGRFRRQLVEARDGDRTVVEELAEKPGEFRCQQDLILRPGRVAGGGPLVGGPQPRAIGRQLEEGAAVDADPFADVAQHAVDLEIELLTGQMDEAGRDPGQELVEPRALLEGELGALARQGAGEDLGQEVEPGQKAAELVAGSLPHRAAVGRAAGGRAALHPIDDHGAEDRAAGRQGHGDQRLQAEPALEVPLLVAGLVRQIGRRGQRHRPAGVKRRDDPRKGLAIEVLAAAAADVGGPPLGGGDQPRAVPGEPRQGSAVDRQELAESAQGAADLAVDLAHRQVDQDAADLGGEGLEPAAFGERRRQPPLLGGVGRELGPEAGELGGLLFRSTFQDLALGRLLFPPPDLADDLRRHDEDDEGVEPRLGENLRHGR